MIGLLDLFKSSRLHLGAFILKMTMFEAENTLWAKTIPIRATFAGDMKFATKNSPQLDD